jgi:hypothetical protein
MDGEFKIAQLKVQTSDCNSAAELLTEELKNTI